MNRLEELREHVRRLNALLEDPQPGLASWCLLYGQEMQAISDFWNKSEG